MTSGALGMALIIAERAFRLTADRRQPAGGTVDRFVRSSTST